MLPFVPSLMTANYRKVACQPFSPDARRAGRFGKPPAETKGGSSLFAPPEGGATGVGAALRASRIHPRSAIRKRPSGCFGAVRTNFKERKFC